MVGLGAGIAVALWLNAALCAEVTAGAAVPPVPELQPAISVRAKTIPPQSGHLSLVRTVFTSHFHSPSQGIFLVGTAPTSNELHTQKYVYFTEMSSVSQT
jgi:hypothetical protein